jgi:hypothetical protein
VKKLPGRRKLQKGSGGSVKPSHLPLGTCTGRLIGYPELKPHDLRQHHDLEQVRALLGHARIDTTQIYASIRPLKRAISFHEEQCGCLATTPGHVRTHIIQVRGFIGR